MRALWSLPALAFVAACGGGSSPSTPSAPAPLPQPAAWTLAGTLTDTLTGGPVAGATLTFDGRPPVTTAADGRWQLTGTGTAARRQIVKIEAAGYVTRETAVAWNAAGRQDVALDIIPDRAPFSLPFFRQLVRDALDSPGELRPLERWQSDPNFYIRTRNPRTGQPFEAWEVDAIVHAIRESVPQLTGGRFSAGIIETGLEAREARAGYIAVLFVFEPEGEFCGRAYVGADPGQITINYDRCARECGSLKIGPEIIAHEVGHAMGFWHTAGERDIMSNSRDRRCGNVEFSAGERLHARVAYSRPRGNMDVDRDPLPYAAMEHGEPRMIVCYR